MTVETLQENLDVLFDLLDGGDIGDPARIRDAFAAFLQTSGDHLPAISRGHSGIRPLDISALFGGRSLARFNEVRAELFDSTGDSALRPYAGWEDFQASNGLADAVIESLKAAYSGSFTDVDLGIGALLERPQAGSFGATFAALFAAETQSSGTTGEMVMQTMALAAGDVVTLSSGAPTEGDDEIAGTNGNDTIDALGGDDEVSGGDGNDEIVGGAGYDELAGEDGNDFLDGGDDDDTLDGGEGNDELRGGAGQDELYGGEGNDELRGGASDDELYGEDGHDELHGEEGDDFLSGGEGSDVLHGGAGDDELSGEEGSDELYGGAGDDEIEGGAGDDVLSGGEGDDALYGGTGNDTAVYAGNRADYDISTDQAGVTTVTHRNEGAEGSDELTGIEELQFADMSIAVPSSSTPGGQPQGNIAPTATAIGNQTAHAGMGFSLNAASHFADSPGDSLTYSISGPSWLSIDPQTGVITGMPPAAQVTQQELTADANGNYAVPAGGTVQISTEFFHGTAGYNNSFGYYLAGADGKPIGGAIIDNSVRSVGHEKNLTVDLGDYPGATTLGFFLIPNGATKNPGLTDEAPVTFQQHGQGWHVYANGVKLSGEGSGAYFSNTALNADGFDHLKNNSHAGNQNWEDLLGGGDKDFDDANVKVAVHAVQSAPATAGGPVIVTATDSGGLSAQTSFTIAVAPPAPNVGTVEICDETPGNGSLAAVLGERLTANLNLAMNADGISEIRYQWQSSSDGVNWSAIPGATQSRFTPRQSEFGLALRVALTYIFVDAAFSAQTAHSAPTQAVAAPSNGAAGEDDQPGFGHDNGGRGGHHHGADCDDDAPGPNGNASAGNQDAGPTAPAGVNVINGSSQANLLFGTNGADLVFANAGTDHVRGRDGHDIIHGGDGNDILFGGDGDDVLFGEAGNDLLFGGRGDDTLHGGEGDDKLAGGEGDDTLDGGAGDDLLAGGDGDDALAGGAADDTLLGGSGDDLLEGGEGEDLLVGGAGDDSLSGGAAADILLGGGGEDTLSGGSGNDTLSGGAGNDIIIGGLGDDTLTGGAGLDKFIYRVGDGNDTILDFSETEDELELQGDDLTYEVADREYGRDYVFLNGSVLALHNNSGRGSQNSGSGNSGRGSGDDSDCDDDSSGSGSGRQTLDEAWAEMIASGVVDDPASQSQQAEFQLPLSELYDDPGLQAVLGISTIHFSHEDINLIT